jgi:hypothetical protein
MVKLALCFSGDTRTYDKCFESIKNNLLDKFDCDVFISTYETSNEITENILNLYKPKKYIFHNKDNISKDVLEYLNNLKHIKIIIIPPITCLINDVKYTNNVEDYFFHYNKFEKDFKYEKLDLNALCQFFGIYDVSKLCKEYMLHEKIHYDYILRIRLDDKVDNTFILNELAENELLVNCIQCYSNSIKLQDHFFMAKPETFFKISSLYSNFHNIIEIINNNKCWLPSSGYQETLLLI